MSRNVKYVQCAMRRIVAGASSTDNVVHPDSNSPKFGRVLQLERRTRPTGSMAGWLSVSAT